MASALNLGPKELIAHRTGCLGRTGQSIHRRLKTNLLHVVGGRWFAVVTPLKGTAKRKRRLLHVVIWCSYQINSEVHWNFTGVWHPTGLVQLNKVIHLVRFSHKTYWAHVIKCSVSGFTLLLHKPMCGLAWQQKVLCASGRDVKGCDRTWTWRGELENRLVWRLLFKWSAAFLSS